MVAERERSRVHRIGENWVGETHRCKLGVLLLATIAQLHMNTLTLALGSGVTALQDPWVNGTFDLVEKISPRANSGCPF